jgi:hypothetical protein
MAASPLYLAVNVRERKLVSYPEGQNKFVAVGEILWNHYTMELRHGNTAGSGTVFVTDGDKHYTFPADESEAIISLVTEMGAWIQESEKRLEAKR